MKFNTRYFILFLILFILEVLIALYVKQRFIRFVFGDFLIVIMLYYFVKSFIKTTSLKIALSVLLFAYIIEFLQLTKLLAILHLENNKLANLIFGNTFQVTDLVAYTLGIVTVLILERKR